MNLLQAENLFQFLQLVYLAGVDLLETWIDKNDPPHTAYKVAASGLRILIFRGGDFRVSGRD